jgi:exosortase
MKASHSDKGEAGLGRQPASSIALPDLGLQGHFLPCTPSWRNVLALVWFVGVCAWFLVPLLNLFALASENDNFSHILLMPALTSYLLFVNRTAILTSKSWSPMVGMLVMAGGIVCSRLADGQDWTQDRLAEEILALVVTCWGLFLLSFGAACFRTNFFALVMLLFMVPLPTVLLDAVIGFLQRSSADTVDLLFSVIGVPVLREGFIFKLSNFTILIAEECSGIRSFLSLVIISLVAGYWFLTSVWARAVLVAVVVPLAIVKNAFRIVGLALLANYVDPTYITDSTLHRNGGIPLFLLSLIVLFGVVWFLRRSEHRPATTTVQ